MSAENRPAEDQLAGRTPDLQGEHHADRHDGAGDQAEPHHPGHRLAGGVGAAAACGVGHGHLVEQRLVGLRLEVAARLVVGDVVADGLEQLGAALGHLALLRHDLPLGGHDVADVRLDVAADAVAYVLGVHPHPFTDLVQCLRLRLDLVLGDAAGLPDAA